MTNRERLTAALEGHAEAPPPAMIVFYEGYMAHTAGREQWEFDYGTAQDQYDMQLSCIRRHPRNTGFWTWTGMNRGPLEGMRVECENGRPVAVFTDGSRKYLTDTPENTPWNRTPETMHSIYDAARVRSIDDIAVKCGGVPKVDELLSNPSYDVLSRLVKEVGDDCFIWVNHSSLFASATTFLGGMEDALISTITDPDLVEAVLDRVLEQHLVYIEAAAGGGGHGMWNCFMNEGANIMAPDSWRRFVKPRAQRLIARSHELGLKHVAWFLDDCRPMVRDLIDMGIDGIATEQPRAGYSCEPGDLRAAAGESNLCIFGWFWEEHLLKADRSAIRATLRKQYAEAGGDKPFVAATPGITQEVSESTVEMILDEVERLTVVG